MPVVVAGSAGWVAGSAGRVAGSASPVAGSAGRGGPLCWWWWPAVPVGWPAVPVLVAGSAGRGGRQCRSRWTAVPVGAGVGIFMNFEYEQNYSMNYQEAGCLFNLCSMLVAPLGPGLKL